MAVRLRAFPYISGQKKVSFLFLGTKGLGEYVMLNYLLFFFAAHQIDFSHPRGELRAIQESKCASFSGRSALTRFRVAPLFKTRFYDRSK